MAEEATPKPQRLTSKQRKALTLRELFAYEASQKGKSVKDDVARMLRQLDGMTDRQTGQPILDLVVEDMDVGQVIGDLISEGPFRDADLESTARRSRSSDLITRLNTMFSGAGYGQGHVKNETAAYLGEDTFLEESGWRFKRARKIPTEFQPDVYQQAKAFLSDKDIPYEVRLQVGGHLLGGFRPENIGDFKVSGYDRKNGLMTFYDAKSKKNKVVILNPLAIDVIDEAIRIQGDKIGKDGKIFPNKDKNQRIANDFLRERFDQVMFIRPDGSITPEDFTVYKFRNMHETLLTDLGLSKDDINFLNGRKNADEAAGYVAEAARKRRIDDANRRVVGMISGYMGNTSTSQLGLDIGLTLSDKTKNIVVSADLLTVPEYVDALPNKDKFISAVEPDFGTGVHAPDAAPKANPEAAAQYNAEQMAASKAREEGFLLTAAEKKEKRLAVESKLEEIDEEAEREKARRRYEKQQIQKDETAKLKGNLDVSDEISEEGKSLFNRLGLKPTWDVTEKAPEPKPKPGGKITKIVGGAALAETARQFIGDPLGTTAALAAEVGLEKVAGAGAGTALSVALTPSRSAGPELTQPTPPPRMAEDPYPGQPEYQSFRTMREMAMEPALDESTEEMERIATEDAGFMTRNRD